MGKKHTPNVKEAAVTSRVENGWGDDGKVLNVHRATGTRRVSGVQRRFQPRQTDSVSGFELNVVRNEWGGRCIEQKNS
jgi:hypothetical protein